MESKPITDISELDFNKSYTVGYYFSWRFDEMVEIIEGKLFKMSPASRSSHLAIYGNIYFSIREKSIFRSGKKIKAKNAKFLMHLSMCILKVLKTTKTL